MISLVMKLFACLRGPLVWLKVDFPQFCAILETKLTLDNRRRPTAFQSRSKKPPSSAFAFTLLMYVFMGMFVGATVGVIHDPLVSLTIVHAFVMTMVAMTLISDFSSVLLDTTDNAILQPRPVDGRTILAARIAHIVTYLSALSLSLSLCTLVMGTIRYHAFFPFVYLGTLAFSLMLVVCIANVFYLLAMRLTNPDRFRDIILYIQIVMTVLVVGAYQLMPRLLDKAEMISASIQDRWWIYVFPPTWMAAPVDILTGQVGTPQIILTCLAIIVPAAGMITVVYLLAPGFERALQRMEAASPAAAPDGRPGVVRRSLAERFGRIVAADGPPRAAFEFVWQLCTRERQFKRAVYPSIFFVAIFAGVFLFMDQDKGFAATLAELPTTRKHLLLLYVACCMFPMAIILVPYTETPEAAWLYEALPVDRRGTILVAAWKVVVLRFVAPALVITCIPVFAIWGIAALSDVLLAIAVTLMITVLQGFIFGRRLPFSEPYSVLQSSGRMFRGLLITGIPAAFGGVHYLLTMAPHGVLLALPAPVFMTGVLLRSYSRTK